MIGGLIFCPSVYLPLFPERFLPTELDCRSDGAEVGKRNGEFPTDRCGNYGKIQLYLLAGCGKINRVFETDFPRRKMSLSFTVGYGWPEEPDRMTASHTSDT